MNTQEEIQALQKRAAEVNNKIIETSTKKDIALKRVKELLTELGYESEGLTNEQILQIVEKLEAEEQQKIADFKTKIEQAEEILKSQENIN